MAITHKHKKQYLPVDQASTYRQPKTMQSYEVSSSTTRGTSFITEAFIYAFGCANSRNPHKPIFTGMYLCYTSQWTFYSNQILPLYAYQVTYFEVSCGRLPFGQLEEVRKVFVRPAFPEVSRYFLAKSPASHEVCCFASIQRVRQGFYLPPY